MLSLQELIKQVHFNEKVPENHNVFISNLRDNNASIFNGTKWELRDRKQVVDELYTDNKTHLEEKFDELEDKLPDCSIKKFKRFMNCQNKEKECINEKKCISRIIHDYNEVPLKTKKNKTIKC